MPNTILECPVLRPTMDEVANFEKYITKHEKLIMSRGVCKIVAPTGWQPCSSSVYRTVDFNITKPIRQNAIGSRGVYRMLYLEEKGMGSKELAATAEKEAEKQRGSVQQGGAAQRSGTDDVERNFWKNVSLHPPLYGADVMGSLFDDRLKVLNLKHLDTVLTTVLEENGLELPGVTRPYLYWGTSRSVFAWHTEDLDLYSINYLHFGAPKQWYVVPPEHRQRFEQVMRSLAPGLFMQCSQFLRHKELLVSPQLLDQYRIPYVKVTQFPREFMINSPGAYHAGFNWGYNAAESVNFATKKWVPVGARAGVCNCNSDSVKIDMRLFRHLVPAKLLPEDIFQDTSSEDSTDSGSDEEFGEEEDEEGGEDSSSSEGEEEEPPAKKGRPAFRRQPLSSNPTHTPSQPQPRSTKTSSRSAGPTPRAARAAARHSAKVAGPCCRTSSTAHFTANSSCMAVHTDMDSSHNCMPAKRARQANSASAIGRTHVQACTSAACSRGSAVLQRGASKDPADGGSRRAAGGCALMARPVGPQGDTRDAGKSRASNSQAAAAARPQAAACSSRAAGRDGGAASRGSSRLREATNTAGASRVRRPEPALPRQASRASASPRLERQAALRAAATAAANIVAKNAAAATHTAAGAGASAPAAPPSAALRPSPLRSSSRSTCQAALSSTHTSHPSARTAGMALRIIKRSSVKPRASSASHATRRPATASAAAALLRASYPTPAAGAMGEHPPASVGGAHPLQSSHAHPARAPTAFRSMHRRTNAGVRKAVGSAVGFGMQLSSERRGAKSNSSRTARRRQPPTGAAPAVREAPAPGARAPTAGAVRGAGSAVLGAGPLSGAGMRVMGAATGSACTHVACSARQVARQAAQGAEAAAAAAAAASAAANAATELCGHAGPQLKRKQPHKGTGSSGGFPKAGVKANNKSSRGCMKARSKVKSSSIDPSRDIGLGWMLLPRITKPRTHTTRAAPQVCNTLAGAHQGLNVEARQGPNATAGVQQCSVAAVVQQGSVPPAYTRDGAAEVQRGSTVAREHALQVGEAQQQDQQVPQVPQLQQSMSLLQHPQQQPSQQPQQQLLLSMDQQQGLIGHGNTHLLPLYAPHLVHDCHLQGSSQHCGHWPPQLQAIAESQPMQQGLLYLPQMPLLHLLQQQQQLSQLQQQHEQQAGDASSSGTSAITTQPAEVDAAPTSFLATARPWRAHAGLSRKWELADQEVDLDAGGGSSLNIGTAGEDGNIKGNKINSSKRGREVVKEEADIGGKEEGSDALLEHPVRWAPGKSPVRKPRTTHGRARSNVKGLATCFEEGSSSVEGQEVVPLCVQPQQQVSDFFSSVFNLGAQRAAALATSVVHAAGLGVV